MIYTVLAVADLLLAGILLVKFRKFWIIAIGYMILAVLVFLYPMHTNDSVWTFWIGPKLVVGQIIATLFLIVIIIIWIAKAINKILHR